MKKICLIILLFTGKLQAQDYTINGKVNVDSNLPAQFLSVMLYQSSDSLLYKTTVTDATGKFSYVAVRGNTYFLVVKGVGFKEYSSPVFRLTNNLSLPVIIMQTMSRELASVAVIARKPIIEVLPDKTVFNVAGSLASTGISAFEVMRKAPGVFIDPQNNLIVEGKTGVNIYINGKSSPLSGEDLVSYLKSIQSSDIEAIEIITQPSAKYDAAGNAGIINLRLKKNKNFGNNGSLNIGYAIGQYGKYNGSLSLNHRNARINIFANYSNSFGKNTGYLNLDRFQFGYEYNQRSTNISDDYSHNFRGGLNYMINSKSTIGVLFNGSFNGYQSVNTSKTPISNDTTRVVTQVLNAESFTKKFNRNPAINLNFLMDNKKGKELSIDFDYGYFQSDRNNLQPNYYYNSQETAITSQSIYRMITPVGIHLAAIKADYTQAIQQTKVSVGVKLSSVKTENTFNFYDVIGMNETYNTLRSNRFDYLENINALYANISRSWKSLSLQAGLRVEQTISDGELSSFYQSLDGSVKRNYFDLFPSGGLTYALNPKNSLAFTYSRRVERPDYRSLNPFEYNLDELSFSKGNPFLKPQYSDVFKISHTYKYTLNTSLSYSYTTNFFAQITDTAGNNRTYISPQNIANVKVINLGVSYPFDIAKWWNVYTNLDAYQSNYTSKSSKFEAIRQNTLSFYGQNTFTLPADYRLEVSGWFNSPSIWAGTYRTKSLGSLDIAVQKQFSHKTLSLRMAVSDVLKTSNWTGTTRYGQLFIKGSGGYESRQFRISLTYNFGRKEIKSIDPRKSGVEDENKRIKN